MRSAPFCWPERHRLNQQVVGRAVAAMLATMVLTGASSASQQPLCPDPIPADTYLYSCQQSAKVSVGKFLGDFTMDHQRRSTPPFQYRLQTLLRLLGLENALDAESAGAKTLFERREAIGFTRLDESSGEFLSAAPQADDLSLEQSTMLGTYTLQLTLPAAVQGLYWRSPTQLDLQFYKGHQPHFRFHWGEQNPLEQDVLCISITAERMRVVTANPNHQHLMILYEDCQ